jgi:hypothetical protein
MRVNCLRRVSDAATQPQLRLRDSLATRPVHPPTSLAASTNPHPGPLPTSLDELTTNFIHKGTLTINSTGEEYTKYKEKGEWGRGILVQRIIVEDGGVERLAKEIERYGKGGRGMGLGESGVAQVCGYFHGVERSYCSSINTIYVLFELPGENVCSLREFAKMVTGHDNGKVDLPTNFAKVIYNSVQHGLSWIESNGGVCNRVCKDSILVYYSKIKEGKLEPKSAYLLPLYDPLPGGQPTDTKIA